LSFIYFYYGRHPYSQHGSVTGTEAFGGSLSILEKSHADVFQQSL